MNSELSIYEQLGGGETIRKLVESFYPKVQQNAVISHLFPEDINPVMDKQYLFLTQFFGGPPLYTEQYGHPMMRKRHLPFKITPKRAEAWLDCMSRALEDIGLEESLQKVIITRLSAPAYFFVNSDEEEVN